MFIRNTTNEEVGPITHEGFEFIAPVGVSAIWDSAGSHVLTLYKVEGEEGGVPPILPADRKDWDGVTFTTVRRYQIAPHHIPNRNDLISLAEKRGVDEKRIQHYRDSEDIENEEIVRDINSLSVPEDIRIPERPNHDNNELSSQDHSDAGRTERDGGESSDSSSSV